MNLRINPAAYLEGSVGAVPSKSYSIRAFFIAALGGKSLIIEPSLSQDSSVARLVCANLGSRIKRIKKNTWQVTGAARLKFPSQIKVKESGTALRFLLSLAALKNTEKDILITGEGTLAPRPNRPLLEVLRNAGAQVKGRGEKESIPILVRPGRIKPGSIKISGNFSSQFISSLLISLPLLPTASTVEISGNYIVSLPYIDMTLSVLRIAGIKIIRRDKRHFFIPGRQKFKGLKKFTVPADYGLAAFIIAAGLLCKSDITIKGIGSDNLVQADKNILFILKKMGAKIKVSQGGIKINGPQDLKGADFNLRDSPDLVPITAILALFAKGRTRIYGISHVRAKESDRISDLRRELLKAGADIREKSDELLIYPQKTLKRGVVLDPHHDHRLAMAFCVLGLKAGLAVKDINCVKKSYPNFLSDLKTLKAQFVT